MAPRPVTLRARQLRANATDAERVLWGALRGRRLGGMKWRRELPVGPYLGDFACLAIRLIVELDGSRHSEQTAEDQRRSDWLTRQGWQVLRFWNGDVFTNLDGVCTTILRATGGQRKGGVVRRPTPHPLP